MILLIDNYDSFAYNLYQLIGSFDEDLKVIRNDAYTVEEIANMNAEAIVLSPGPGRPSDAGICIHLVRELKGQVPILGVCLGHQAICEAFGGVVSYAKEMMHGKTSIIDADTTSTLFHDMKKQIKVARYHSLAAEQETFPEELIVTARAQDGEIMAIEHRKYPIYGVQFHPESILTPDGAKMIENFLEGR